jgi:trigger factor
LKIETHPREDHQITMVVEIDAERLEGARHRAARKISDRAKIPGFRPGKAPYDVVRRLYGEAVITEEAVEILVDDIYPQAIKEADIQPAGQGQLENIESMDPPKFVFTVPLAPTVELGDYRSVRLPYEWVAPGEDKLDEAIADLRRMYSSTETVERAAQEGDFVLVDVTGSKAKPKEGEENAPLLERNGYAALVRKDEKEDEWPFSGFSKKLVGVKPGEETEFTHKFDKDHSDEVLQGQNVRFKVKVKTVRGVNMPELDDEFAKKSGLGQTVDELHTRMRENLDAESRAEYEDKYYEDLIGQIKTGATIKYPPQVLDHEMAHVLEDVESRLKSQGIANMDAYYKMINTTREQFVEEQAKPVAQRRLERGLIMDEIARAEKIEVDEQSLEQEFNNAWATLAMTDPEFSKRTKGGTRPTREMIDAVAMDSANRLLTRRVLDQLKAIATGEAGELEPAAKKTTAKKTAAKKPAAKAKGAATEEKAVKKPAAKKPAAKAAAATTEEKAVKKPAAKKPAAKKADNEETTPVKKKPAAAKKKSE